MKNKKPLSLYWILALAFGIVWLVIADGPFYYLILISMKSQGEFLTGSLFQLPEHFNLTNFGSSHEMVEFKRKECKIGVWKKKMYMGSMTGCWE
ncbi:hypothetical protein FACS1894137_16350 [Spirochaetia bacterium]|nr:hypothetical protein FACS1894137_16350 [Spirochaetia bacterium]